MAPGHGPSRGGKKTRQNCVVVVIILFWWKFPGAGEAAWEALRLLLGPAREGKEGPSPAWPGPRCSPAGLWLFWGTPSSETRHLPAGFGENQPLGSLASSPGAPLGPRGARGGCGPPVLPVRALS